MGATYKPLYLDSKVCHNDQLLKFSCYFIIIHFPIYWSLIHWTHDNKYIEILSLIFYCFIYREPLEYKIIFVIFHILQRYTKPFDEVSNVADGPPFFLLDPSWPDNWSNIFNFLLNGFNFYVTKIKLNPSAPQFSICLENHK